ncbi:sugar dehydrogenase complex small subunit [Achromobacter seleniivolatilans]|uniref:Sugar dehydrogenase complex small subunit n=1 Tax=Achromobacter seleniivolatilans TaxID=3047478 RepID=A0ABY9M1L6_9BURK|nr:sugar dehydrogenase complex small subunit [Achromobacter sp. R39]WMD20887.1 sugar dehydrogenase complex small subunit [Achromobacter sp. R39]
MMTSASTSTQSYWPRENLTSFGLARRNALLASAAGIALIAAGGIPAARAADTSRGVLASPPSNFQEVSRYLTGEAQLEPGLSSRLYAGLLAVNPQFTDALNALAASIRRHTGPAETLDVTLAIVDPELPSVAKQILTAWTLGVTGNGLQARCLAFEDALSYRFVRDKTRPPSYAYGQYGSWSSQPTEVKH